MVWFGLQLARASYTQGGVEWLKGENGKGET